MSCLNELLAFGVDASMLRPRQMHVGDPRKALERHLDLACFPSAVFDATSSVVSRGDDASMRPEEGAPDFGHHVAVESQVETHSSKGNVPSKDAVHSAGNLLPFLLSITQRTSHPE